MAWQDQGRQEHGWFGHGHGPGRDAGAAERRELRARAFVAFGLAAERFAREPDAHSMPYAETQRPLAALVPSWAEDADLPPDALRRRYFGDHADPLDAWAMQRVAREIRSADNHHALRDVADTLADGLRTIGLRNVRGLLRDAVSHAVAAVHAPRPVLRLVAAAEPPDGPEGDAARAEQAEDRRLLPHLPRLGHVPNAEEVPEAAVPRFGAGGARPPVRPAPADAAAGAGRAGAAPTELPRAAVVPTPRDGVVGGTPTGMPEADRPGNTQQQAGARLQHESEKAFAAAGYRVELQPTIHGEDGVDPGKRPDLRLGGNITDVVAPNSDRPEQIRRRIQDKVYDKQAFHIVLNLGRTTVSRGEITALLQRKPIRGLRELFIHDRDGSLYRVFPDPEQLYTSGK